MPPASSNPTFSMPQPAAASRVQVNWIALPLFVLALCAVNVLLHWPGTLNNDSINQLRQAINGQYADWHPPVMAWFWSLLLPFGEGPAPMLIAQLGLYWLGVGLLADGVRRAGHGQLAWLVAACGAFPPFLYLNAVISKDAGMVSAWVGALGLFYWFRAQRRTVPAWAVVAIGALLAYGTLVRTNAIFAIGPLLAYMAMRTQPRLTRLLGAAVVGAVLALPLSQWINTSVLQAKAQQAVHSLFLYDLLGVAAHTGQPELLQPRVTLTKAELQACYTPYWWDSLSPWGRCAAKVNKPGVGESVTVPEGLAQQWIRTIASEPAAYLAHRVRHFNSSLLFMVPRKHIRFTPEYGAPGQDWKPVATVSEREIRGDLLRKNPASWPAVWLVWGGFLALWLARKSGPSRALATAPEGAAPLALTLCVAALMYSGAYLVVGVATDMRYHYWSLLALLLATTLVLPALWKAIRQREPLLLAGLAAATLVMALGTASRVADWRGLF